jgi:heme/copper-type cytochrome/quinol oxidase subunit 4
MWPSNKTNTNKHKTHKLQEEQTMDGKSFVFVVAFVAAVVLVILGIFSMVFDNLTISSSKVYMDFIFAGVLAVLAIIQFKALESGEKA